ncbi:hypothetical protein QG37_07055 [Candidozyma auris]|nr:hypothetical protein QG37_07055 [[Candida] auris]
MDGGYSPFIMPITDGQSLGSFYIGDLSKHFPIINQITKITRIKVASL